VISIRLHPAAQREIRRAFDWYLQEAGQRIAAGFLDDFEQTLALLKNHPELANPAAATPAA
jgi:plasmid stabilization system protein ParE